MSYNSKGLFQKHDYIQAHNLCNFDTPYQIWLMVM